MNNRRMAGRFWTMPFEVHDLLDEIATSDPAWRLYRSILRRAFIDEDWEADDRWVMGRFQAERSQIKNWAGFSKTHFYRIFPSLIEAGLISPGDGTDQELWELPKFKKIKDAEITIREIKEMASQLRLLWQGFNQMIAAMSQLTGQPVEVVESRIWDSIGEKPPLSTYAGGQDGTDSPSQGTDSPSGGTARSSCKSDLEFKDPPPLLPYTRSSGSQEAGQKNGGGGGGGGFGLSEEQEYLKAKLMDIGILENRATDLVLKFSLVRIMSNIESLRESLKTGKNRIEDPAALLIWRINEDYAAKNENGDHGSNADQ